MELNYRLLGDQKDTEHASLLRSHYSNLEFTDFEENNSIRPFKIPKFMSNKNKCCNGLFRKICCCSCKNHKENITQEELKAYYKLKELAQIYYNELNEDHENSLKNLFINTLNCDLTDNLETMEWKGIGFQGSNPRTDFRASGYLALLFLNFFVGQYKEEFDIMNHIDCFMTAVAGIRLTFLFKVTFNMLDKDEEYKFFLRQYNLRELEYKHFKTFLKYQSYDENFVLYILAKCLISSKNLFLKKYNKELGIRNIHNLDKCIDEKFRDVLFNILNQ